MIRVLVACLLACYALAAQAAGRVFYDSFEYSSGTTPYSGTSPDVTNQWTQDDYRNRCKAVTSAADGGVGPHSGSRMARCNWNGVVAWNDPASVETLVLNLASSNEVLLRAWIRVDNNAKDHPADGPKIYRFGGCNDQSYISLNFRTGYANGSWYSCNPFTQIGASYWGGEYLSGPSWNKIEIYIKQATSGGIIRMWENDTLVWSGTGNTSQPNGWFPFHISSNWSGATGCCDHDTTNYLYWDDVEVFTEAGTGGVGTMSDGSMTQGTGGGDTTPPVISGLLPTGSQATTTTAVTLQATTDESATCRYNTTDVAYTSMLNTFTNTGGTSHSNPNFPVSSGNSYTRYVRCIDGSGNANTSSSIISFSVANPSVSAVTCTQASPTQSPGSIPCSGTISGTATSYSWSLQTPISWCSFSPASLNTTLTCQYGANPRPCLTILPGSSSACALTNYPFRYNKPSGFGTN